MAAALLLYDEFGCCRFICLMAFVACACVLDDFSLERVDAERCVAELSSPILLCFPLLTFLRIRRQRPHLSTCSFLFFFFTFEENGRFRFSEGVLKGREGNLATAFLLVARERGCRRCNKRIFTRRNNNWTYFISGRLGGK
ncbi:hypothetical protein TcCL_NonESM00748 [Trypanosoma cruzi]|nr:hypothetical protein TcCL_NonESM00748 [Trypanosoma cruzi]